MLLKTRMNLLAVAVIANLCACGGGGGGGGGSIGGGGSGSGSGSGSWTAGVYQPASNFAAKCASPRSGSSTVTGRPFPDVQGTALDERNWLRSWTNDLYLWYSEVQDLNPANYTTPNYFGQLKTTATTASGQPKDKFHFTYATAQWEALSLGGVESGYGLKWEVISATSTSPPRVFIAYLEPGQTTPAAQANLARGAEVQSVDSVSLAAVFTQAQADTVNNGLFPNGAGQSHTFTLREVGGNVRTVTLQSIQTTSASVTNVQAIDTGSGFVGYIQFNDHLYPSEQAIINAIDTLKAANNGAGVADLLLDIRYNGGGLLDVASELAYMIAGPALTAGQTFERTVFNDKHPSTNPVTGQPLQPTPFHTTTQGFSVQPGSALPTLNLSRVFVLTGDGTCSASESIINGLRGVNVEVIQIGSTTCGKPYGFYPTDNCGTTYFSIQLKGVNAKNFGDYTDGFSPQNTAVSAGERIPGCSVADDFNHELGNPLEARFAAALNYRLSPSCPAATGMGPSDRVQPQSVRLSSEASMHIRRPFWRENRILRE